MTVTTDGAVRVRTVARTSGKGPARAAEQLTRADRAAMGKDARASAPLESHAEFMPDASRDPVGLLLEQAKSRVPELVPVRHGRMPIEQMIPSGMTVYARLCGWTLARAHARSGDRIALAAYLGGSTKFDQAIADFAETYADQNERDYAALRAAVKDGRAEATTEI